MKAAYINQTGPPEVIQVGELPDPLPRPSEVLVRVIASAVNPIDTYIRSGAVAMELPMPFIPGCDFAGVVERVGTEVDSFAPGDRVWGSNQGLLGRQGTLAELAVVNQQWVYPIPDGVSDEAAAAGALVGVTAHLGLVRGARLAAGETVFVNGGSGGVGQAVIQLAKALGARVIATAGSDEKLALCRALGADAAVSYREDDLAGAAAAVLPGFQGANVWWETTRQPDFDRIFACLAADARVVVIAGRDARPEFPVGPFYVKGLSLHGFAMFNASPDAQRAAADDINRHLASGAYRPRIDRVMPLDQAAEAHRLQEANTLHGAGTLAGKIVVKIAG
jgi:NADPH2:quinone reductase